MSLVYDLTVEMPCYDVEHPWSRDDVRGLLHREGAVVADARPDELAGLGEPQRTGSGRMRSFAAVGRRRVSWLWPGYLARDEFTVLDGAKGCGKSLVVADVAARLSRGDALPGDEERGTGEAVVTALFSSESAPETETGPRLDAAGAVVSRVFCPELERDRRGKVKSLELPDSGPEFGRRIRACGAGLAVWDPINDFLAEDIQTHNDASIRRALGPLGLALRESGCAGLLIRHLNKNTGAEARMRGAGSTAYQNRARVHLLCARLPDGAHPIARFGLAVLDSNLRRVAPGVLVYNIVDSDIPLDDDGGYVAHVEWYGRIDMDPDELARGTGGRSRRGPDPYAERLAVKAVNALFDGRTRVPAAEVEAALVAEGITPGDNSDLLRRVKQTLDVRSERRRGAAAREDGPGWDWVRGKYIVRRNG